MQTCSITGAPQNQVKLCLILLKLLAINKSLLNKLLHLDLIWYSSLLLLTSWHLNLLNMEILRFPKERVIGSGTSLDSARFRQALAELSVDARSAHAHYGWARWLWVCCLVTHNVAGVKLNNGCKPTVTWMKLTLVNSSSQFATPLLNHHRSKHTTVSR